MTFAHNRRLFDVQLRAVNGSRFQPTGFPDIGAATFRRPDAERGSVDCLIVESAQSMANNLEAVGWDEAAQAPVPTLEGLPWVRVLAADDGRYLTSSRTEAHRLASAFVKDSVLDGVGMREVVRERLALHEDTPLAPRSIAAAVMALDPLCLVHGVFFAEPAKVWPGQPKIARALTGFIEASGVEAAISGGVKREAVLHKTTEGGTAKEGYGSIPFHRTEYTAEAITASFSLDLAQLRSYGLPQSSTDLLEAIALWEIRSLLDGGLRLRTACDLAPVDGAPTDNHGQLLPDVETLAERVRTGIAESSEVLGVGGPLDVQWSAKRAGMS